SWTESVHVGQRPGVRVASDTIGTRPGNERALCCIQEQPDAVDRIRCEPGKGKVQDRHPIERLNGDGSRLTLVSVNSVGCAVRIQGQGCLDAGGARRGIRRQESEYSKKTARF